MKNLLFTSAALAVLGIGCGKSGDGGPCTTCPSSAIAISVSTGTLTIEQGGNGSLIATITRSGGFTGVVSIVTEGAPSGVAASASNVSTNGNVTTGTVTVTVAGSVAPGTYNLLVRGSGAGVTSVTQALTLTVTATPAIALALSASTQSVEQGATGTALTVTINRTNYPLGVSLAVEGAPAGVSVTFIPNNTTENSSALTLQVGAAVPAQTYNLTIRATGTGVAAATTLLALTVTVPPSFTLSATDVAINQGAQGTSTVTVGRVNFPVAVTLALEGAPIGVTGVFNPAAPTTNTSTLTLSVGASVTPGPHTLTVRGTAAGLPDRTTTFILTVNAVMVGSYTLTTSPASSLLVATASGGTAFVVNVNRTGGFTGPETLSASGFLSSLTGTITPSVVTGNSVVVTVVPDQSSLVGSSLVTITGTTPGLANQTAQIQVATAIPDMTFDYSACTSSTPVALWYQDGVTGPWIQLLPLNGKFKIKLSQTQVGFAVSTPSFGGGGQPPWVRLRSATELKAMGSSEFCDDGNPGPNNPSVSVVNMPSIFDQALIALGGAQRSASSALPTVALNGAAAGFHDLVAHTQNQQGGPPNSTHRIIVRRGLNTGSSPISPALDFGPLSVEAFAPIATTITPTGLAGGEIINGTGGQYYTAGTGTCDAAPLYSQSFGAAIASFQLYGLPPAIPQAPSDMYGVFISTQGTETFRSVNQYFHTFGPQTVPLGSFMPVPVITSIPGPTFRLQFVMTMPSDLTGALFVRYGVTGGNVFLEATPAWLGGTSVTLALPDFTGSANFNPAQVQAPLSSSWNIAAEGAPADPCGGGRFVSANRSGVFPP
jgi:hypothetical protein